MSTIPDFVYQVQETEHNLNSEWQCVHEAWQDIVAEGFREGTMEPYMRNFQQYLTGDGISGLGLEQLLIQMDKHLNDMASLLN